MRQDQGRKVLSTFPCYLPQGPQNFPCCCYDKILQGIYMNGVFCKVLVTIILFPALRENPCGYKKL
jgi:hypothetical protein